ncbi:hypothetical protein KKD62_03115 [Patescibacteria group bacterium]|nr:hypothetical protein [Patescibacteria group bacterium]MBU1931546.1 hypothetical protein [Patescibacteria group bacterium]
MSKDFVFKLRKEKPDKRIKTSPRERLVIAVLFVFTVILSLFFWLKVELKYWWQNWRQPTTYHFER